MASRGPGTTAPISFLPATCGVAVLALVDAGGALLSVDLDNRRGQELTHHWLWKAGGGVRWQRSPSAEGLLDLRYDEYHVRGHSPLANFTLRCFALGGTIVRHQRRRSRRER
jgi:hypothetical protein